VRWAGRILAHPVFCWLAATITAIVDINTIRAWLGHVSLNTTNVYAEVDLEMKAKALATCEVHGAVPQKHWKKDIALMQFLRSL
jgi:integrase/recombinase XerD